MEGAGKGPDAGEGRAESLQSGVELPALEALTLAADALRLKPRPSVHWGVLLPAKGGKRDAG